MAAEEEQKANMDEDKMLAALGQLHDDMKELIGAVRTNYEGVKSFNEKMRRLYIGVITLAPMSYFFYPWFYNHITRMR